MGAVRLLSLFGLLILTYCTNVTPNLPTHHLRHAMFYEFSRGSSSCVAAENINNVYGQGSISVHTVREWYTRFRSGDRNLEDQPRPGRPLELENSRIIQLLHENPQQTTRELADSLGVDHSTVVRHLDDLQYRSLLGSWVPHDLSDSAKAQRVSISASLLSRYERHSFLPRLLTCDESWVFYANVGRKRQWVGPEEHPAAEPKPDIHRKKQMLSVFWDLDGVVHWELLPSGHTINAMSFSLQLDRVVAKLSTKRPNKHGIILQMDNARPHIVKLARNKIKSLDWEFLPHPPYSPDLAPSDYHLFRHLKAEISGQHFGSFEDLESWLETFFDDKPRIFYDRGIRKLPVKWAEVVEHDGEYTV